MHKKRNETRNSQKFALIFYETVRERSASLRPIKMFFLRKTFLKKEQSSSICQGWKFTKCVFENPIKAFQVRGSSGRRKKMSLLTLHGQSALHAAASRAKASSSSSSCQLVSVRFHRKWQIKRIECKLHTAKNPSLRSQWARQCQPIDLERFLNERLIQACSTNWHKTCTQTFATY